MTLFTTRSILAILVTILFVCFPFTNVLRLELTNDIAVNGIDFLVVITAGVWFVHYLIERPRYRFGKPIIIFFSICLFSLVINTPELTLPQFKVALLYLLRFIGYTCVYFAVSSLVAKEKIQLRSLLFVSGSMVVFFGYVQYLFFSDLRMLGYLGWDEHIDRMFSTFFDPNFAGAFFTLFFLFVLCHFFQKSKTRNAKKQTLYCILLIVTLISIFLTFSRSALLMLAVGSIIALLLLDRIRVLLFGGIAFLIVILMFVKLFTSENTNLFRMTSSIARIDTMREAITISQKAPLFGVGFNAYKFALQRNNLRENSGYLPDHGDLGTDNSFIFVLATTGIIGIGAYCYLWFAVLRGMVGNMHTMNIIVVSSILGLAVNSLFINSQFYPFILVWVWTIIGLTDT